MEQEQGEQAEELSEEAATSPDETSEPTEMPYVEPEVKVIEGEGGQFDPTPYLMRLQNKMYLPVNARILWARTVHSKIGIVNELVELDRVKEFALFRCTVYDENGKVLAQDYGSETAKDFKDYIEKAATKAAGRALGQAGFGTQFTGDELQEGVRKSTGRLNIADSPVNKPKPPAPPAPPRPAGPTAGATKRPGPPAPPRPPARPSGAARG